jgi:hypothetical protein
MIKDRLGFQRILANGFLDKSISSRSRISLP